MVAIEAMRLTTVGPDTHHAVVFCVYFLQTKALGKS